MRKLANRNKVKVTKPTRMAEAVRVTIPVTVLICGSKVGIGRSVGVVGGGTIH